MAFPRNQGGPTGYKHPAYMGSFAQFGRPLHLVRCNGWLLERTIPGTTYKDAMGGYPFFCCDNWEELKRDLEDVGPRLVSLVLVPEPFGKFELPLLEQCFDHVVQYKKHYVVDMDRPIHQTVKRSHQATVRRAQKKVDVRICPRPPEYLDRWTELFDNLRRRHHISGIRAFSKEAFAGHLEIPGLVMFEARAEGVTVGLDLWYVQGDIAYGHLVAFNDLGYKLRASYATKWAVLKYFSDKVRWLDLGGAAGSGGSRDDGLARFKQGWSTDTKSVYLCTRVFQRARYEELCDMAGASSTSYFPAYRDSERV